MFRAASKLVRNVISAAIVVFAMLLLARTYWHYALNNTAVQGGLPQAFLQGLRDVSYRWAVVAAGWVATNIVKVPDLIIGFITN